MRIATCTPVDFAADSQFFGRDSGLLCRGFQSAGHDAFVVMPGLIRPDDEPGVTRCTAVELESSAWWKSQQLNLVVLYAWGDPRYRQVAEAIREAGIFLMQSLDTAGLTTPYGNTREWWQCFIGMLAGPQHPVTRIRRIAKACRDFLPRIYEHKRLTMIDCSDTVALVSEPALRSVATYARALGYPKIADKLIVVPHPVSPLMVAGTEPKLKKVLVVGRWLEEDHHQKDPELTMKVLEQFLEACPEWSAEVVGRASTELHNVTEAWHEDARKRITLTETMPRSELVARYRQSRILLCCSRHESFHISSAEALCCGCSVVVADHPLLASTGWFTKRNSGTLATSRMPINLLNALLDEARKCEEGIHTPDQIANSWASDLRADSVTANLIEQIKLYR
jgi:glycosyltransferase involved in cell wall biosynthesis